MIAALDREVEKLPAGLSNEERRTRQAVLAAKLFSFECDEEAQLPYAARLRGIERVLLHPRRPDHWAGVRNNSPAPAEELSPIFGDGLIGQAATVVG
jgi:hypothetical protein